MLERLAKGLEISGITKSYNGTRVLQPLVLDIRPGEIHALLGENGSGKSTTIKILAGVVIPDHADDAKVLVGGKELELGNPHASYALGFRFVHQDLGLVASSSITDNILLNTGFPTRFGTICKAATAATVRDDLARVGLEDLHPDTLIRDLSPAIRTGIAVARALRPDRHSEAKVLVLDEPTATLPEDEVSKLMRAIRAVAARGIAVIYVTHRLDEVFTLADNVTVLRDGHKVGTVPVADLTREHLVNLIVGEEFQKLEAAQTYEAREDGECVLRVEGLVAGPVKGASLKVRAGEIVGIAGLTGSGSESVLAAIFGRTARKAGKVFVKDTEIAGQRPDLAIGAGIAYLPPERKVLGGFMEMTALENLGISHMKPLTRRSIVQRALEITEARKWFERFSVRPAGAFDAPLVTFSGGNQQKVLFAKWLRRHPTVFLLDEPTQGVDVNAKALLHKELRRDADAGMAVLVNSTDVDELVSICHRVLIFRNGRIVKTISGNQITIPAITTACVHTDDGRVS